jgi:hypothetical protein
MTRTSAFTAGLIICTLLGVLDLVGFLIGITGDNSPRPPIAVLIGAGTLGILTLVAAIPTWRGSRSGLLTVAASRVLSALKSVSVFFVDDAPDWARVIVAVAIAATVVGVWLLVAAGRRAQIEALQRQ